LLGAALVAELCVPLEAGLAGAAVLAAAVLLSVGAPLVSRVKRGKNGVTSNGILSRAEVIATGADFASST
jgi:hypothetical protein